MRERVKQAVQNDDIKLDLSGLKCPLPALLLEKALRNAARGVVIVANATDPLAEVDLPFSAQRTGAEVLEVSTLDGLVTVRVKKQ